MLTTSTWTEFKGLVEAQYGASLSTAEETRLQALANLAASRAYRAHKFWPRFLVAGEPRTIMRGYIPFSEDSFYIYGSGTDNVDGLYVADGDNYIKKKSDGTTEYTLEAFVDAMVVEGAGTAAANTTYLGEESPFSPKDYSASNGSRFALTLDLIYVIQVSDGSGGFLDAYTGSEMASSPDLVASWSVESGGTAPAPTVRRATLDDSGITATYVTWRIVDADDNIVYSNATTSLTPPLTGWTLGTGLTPSPALVDVADIGTALYWRARNKGNYQSRTYEFQADINGLRPWSNLDENGTVFVTYIKRLTDIYGDGTGGTTSDIPAEWFDYMALYAAYMLQASNRQSNASPAFTLALSEVEGALEDQMMRLESQGLPATIRANVETRTAYSNIL